MGQFGPNDRKPAQQPSNRRLGAIEPQRSAKDSTPLSARPDRRPVHVGAGLMSLNRSVITWKVLAAVVERSAACMPSANRRESSARCPLPVDGESE
jgi:hypothetical protein